MSLSLCVEISQIVFQVWEDAGAGFSGGKAEAEILISVRKIYSAWECEVSYYNAILFGLFNGLNIVGGMHLN